MLINNAFAQAAGGAASTSSLGLIVQLVLIFLVFYFILLRPQKKRILEHEAQLRAIKAGNTIITGGGIIAKVKKADEEKLTVSISPTTEIVVLRETVRGIYGAEESSSVKETPSKKRKN
ncbi:MAG: preprotein translocase subunit YajC [Alphaproteobacteria bacterium]|nr:preprotein translocase subunit YajC [Alphaproteobacteria bacterium]